MRVEVISDGVEVEEDGADAHDAHEIYARGG